MLHELFKSGLNGLVYLKMITSLLTIVGRMGVLLVLMALMAGCSAHPGTSIQSRRSHGIPANSGAPQGANQNRTTAHEACELVSAEAVSSIVGETVVIISSARSPKSLCTFTHFPQDPYVTTQEFQPHYRSVVVALFTAETMRQAGVGSVVATVGCRSVVPQCQKAITDDSPAELYNAQGRGLYHCQTKHPSCFMSLYPDDVMWAMQGGEVVAIRVISGSQSGYTPSPTMELGILNYVSLHL